MSNALFSLTSGDKGGILDGPVPTELRIPLEGHESKTVKKKAAVIPGQLVAEHKSAKTGDMHCGIAGVVADTTSLYIAVTAQAPAEPAEGETPPTAMVPVDLSVLEGDALADALKALGVDTRPLIARCETLIINGLNPEPGITLAEAMLAHAPSVLEAGLSLLKKLSPAGSMLLARAAGSSADIGGLPTMDVAPVYPNSLDEKLIVKAAGRGDRSGYRVLPLHTLYMLGHVAETGLPQTETVVCVQGRNYKVVVGTPVNALLEHAGLSVEAGDAIILGGPMRGFATADYMHGINKNTQSVVLIKKGTFAPVSHRQCINCGECVRHCPSRIMPSLITRYVEFREFEQCSVQHISACMECGLCTFYCPARRPMMQLIRLGKHMIALKDAQVGACALQGEEGAA